MVINILQLVDGARKAQGLTIIIDVFRAFSTACYAMECGIDKIFPVGNIEQAYQLKKEHPDYLLVGERNEQKPEGFDFGNSPTHILSNTICASKMIHTTSSGTQGIANAVNAEQIITGSFVNAGAIVRYIKAQKPSKVSLVCMGYACTHQTLEDTLCAEYIKNELENKPNNFERIRNVIRDSDGARFFDAGKQAWAPENDFYLCLDLNRFDFVLKVEQENGMQTLQKIEI